MFSKLELENFGIFNHFVWDDHAKINILIGKNDTGKSHLLKVLYSLAKSVEDYNKQSQPNVLQETFSNILANKLIWIFQPEGKGLGELVTKGQTKLKVQACLREDLRQDKYNIFGFSFGRDTSRKVTDIFSSKPLSSPQNHRAVFIPPKEVLTALDAIAAIRKELQVLVLMILITT